MTGQGRLAIHGTLNSDPGRNHHDPHFCHHNEKNLGAISGGLSPTPNRPPCFKRAGFLKLMDPLPRQLQSLSSPS